MSAQIKTLSREFSPRKHDVIVIGSGPVGVRLVQKLNQLDESISIAVFGDEPWHPYNRVKLSSLLVGEINEDEIYKSMDLSKLNSVRCFYNNRVMEINRYSKEIIDSDGERHSYKKLIIATGSKARIPSIKGIDLNNVYTFRQLDDATRLMGRSVRTKHTVIIGGGLLGIEAARAMQRFNTKVTIIEHSSWLMFNQLDHHSGSFLKHYIESLDIDVRVNESVKKINGEYTVESIDLASGEVIECDTIIVSAGITPNVNLAIDCGLHIGKGIRINDELQTNDINIHAIGECAEHRERTYGLVAPGYEQADVLAHHLHGKHVTYKGTITATNLKVLDYPVFSMGNTGNTERSRESIVFQDSKNEIYRKLTVINGRLRGAVSIGEWENVNRIQQIIAKQKRLWPWHINRFKKTGSLWLEDSNNEISDWPDNTIVCNCTGITKGELFSAKSDGANSVFSLANITGASTVCGGCKPLLAKIANSDIPVESNTGNSKIFIASALSLFLLTMYFLLPGLSYPDSVQLNINYATLWTENLYKQISGYSLLAFGCIISIISARKRIKKLHNFMDYSWWRLLHVITGAVLIIILLAHTGARFGFNLNLYLMLCFIGVLISGSILGITITKEHLLSRKTASSLRNISIWMHVISIWPLPALLGFHIFKTYYF